MTFKIKIAKLITKLVINKAHRAAGQVSINGTYQPKEPKALKKATEQK